MSKDTSKTNRLNELINFFADGNKTKFANILGITPQGLNSWLSRGTYDIELIYSKCERISADWLLTGRGNMLRSEAPVDKPEAVMSYDQQRGVPYYAVDFLGGFDFVYNQQQSVPNAHIIFPQFNRAECWVDISGNSMEPLISNGDLIALRKVEDWQSNILYGEVYAIVTDQYRTVKRIRRSQLPDHIRLVPENPEYDAQDIASASVLAVFAVLGCAKRIS
ncbi:MAG: S24 family peptidase [Bacteroidales bacterium]|nr:S24 family peptidase [Bacteroidales bacterium]